MKLYLMRHGIATERIGGAILNDSQRPLTEEGKAETKLVALGLKRLAIKPDLVVTSPLVRAKQTAEIIIDVLGAKDDLKVTDALAPGGAASDLYKFLRQFNQPQAPQEVFLVGHEPDMGRLAGTLLWAGPELDIPFKKAGVARIDIADVPPTAPGTLKWFLTPKIAALMAGK
jgi:phosphohistidine phosphatase